AGLGLGMLRGGRGCRGGVVRVVFGLFRRKSLASGDWDIARVLSADQAFEGERVVVTITVSAGGPVPVLELFEPLPPSLRLVAGSNRGFFTLVRDQSVSWTYEVECRRRGRASLGVVHARLWDRAGLQRAAGAACLPAGSRPGACRARARHRPQSATTWRRASAKASSPATSGSSFPAIASAT